MGADIETLDRRIEGGEEVADLRVRRARSAASTFRPRAPLDDRRISDPRRRRRLRLGRDPHARFDELRVKESDRLAAVAAGPRGRGVDCAIEGDDLIVEGGRPRGGGMVVTHMDHRIAMSFLIMGLASREPMAIDDAAMIATSFPEFRPTMERLGAKFR